MIFLKKCLIKIFCLCFLLSLSQSISCQCRSVWNDGFKKIDIRLPHTPKKQKNFYPKLRKVFGTYHCIPCRLMLGNSWGESHSAEVFGRCPIRRQNSLEGGQTLTGASDGVQVTGPARVQRKSTTLKEPTCDPCTGDQAKEGFSLINLTIRMPLRM